MNILTEIKDPISSSMLLDSPKIQSPRNLFNNKEEYVNLAFDALLQKVFSQIYANKKIDAVQTEFMNFFSENVKSVLDLNFNTSPSGCLNLTQFRIDSIGIEEAVI